MKRAFEYFKNHRKGVTISLTSIIIVTTLVPLVFYKIPFINIASSRLEIAETVAQIFAAIFVALGVFVAVSQYYFSSKSEIIKIETDKVERAINLAEFYKDNVLQPYAVIKEVYKSAGIYEILQKEKKRMAAFDGEEMVDIFSESEICELQEKYSSPEFLQSMVSLNELLNLNLNGCNHNDEITTDGENKRTIDVDIKAAINDFHINYICRLLNNMELFAMYFTHEIADESVIYQSLYPTYIEMCRTLYYDISKCSPIGQPQLYRNVQGLYEKWLNKSIATSNTINQHKNSMGTILESINNH